MAQVKKNSHWRIVSCFRLLKYIHFPPVLERWVPERLLRMWSAYCAHMRTEFRPLRTCIKDSMIERKRRMKVREAGQMETRSFLPYDPDNGDKFHLQGQTLSQRMRWKATEKNSHLWSLPPYMPAEGYRYTHKKYLQSLCIKYLWNETELTNS